MRRREMRGPLFPSVELAGVYESEPRSIFGEVHCDEYASGRVSASKHRSLASGRDRVPTVPARCRKTVQELSSSLPVLVEGRAQIHVDHRGFLSMRALAAPSVLPARALPADMRAGSCGQTSADWLPGSVCGVPLREIEQLK